MLVVDDETQEIITRTPIFIQLKSGDGREEFEQITFTISDLQYDKSSRMLTFQIDIDQPELISTGEIADMLEIEFWLKHSLEGDGKDAIPMG